MITNGQNHQRLKEIGAILINFVDSHQNVDQDRLRHHDLLQIMQGLRNFSQQPCPVTSTKLVPLAPTLHHSQMAEPTVIHGDLQTPEGKGLRFDVAPYEDEYRRLFADKLKYQKSPEKETSASMKRMHTKIMWTTIFRNVTKTGNFQAFDLWIQKYAQDYLSLLKSAEVTWYKKQSKIILQSVLSVYESSSLSSHLGRGKMMTNSLDIADKANVVQLQLTDMSASAQMGLLLAKVQAVDSFSKEIQNAYRHDTKTLNIKQEKEINALKQEPQAISDAPRIDNEADLKELKQSLLGSLRDQHHEHSRSLTKSHDNLLARIDKQSKAQQEDIGWEKKSRRKTEDEILQNIKKVTTNLEATIKSTTSRAERAEAQIQDLTDQHKKLQTTLQVVTAKLATIKPQLAPDTPHFLLTLTITIKQKITFALSIPLHRLHLRPTQPTSKLTRSHQKKQKTEDAVRLAKPSSSTNLNRRLATTTTTYCEHPQRSKKRSAQSAHATGTLKQTWRRNPQCHRVGTIQPNRVPGQAEEGQISQPARRHPLRSPKGSPCRPSSDQFQSR